MFSIPLDQLEFNHIEEFCRNDPRERVILDFKRDFPNRLEKTIAAFANTFGGHIFIGIDETNTGGPVLPIEGVALRSGLRERVVSIALGAIHPPVYPEVKVVEYPSNPTSGQADRAVVAVRVHESDASAHAVDGGTNVYLRVDNITDPHKRATVEEIEWLSQKRGKCLELKEELIQNAQKHAHNYLLELRSYHTWSTSRPSGHIVIWTVPRFPRNELETPLELLQVTTRVKNRLNIDFPSQNPMPVHQGVRFPNVYINNLMYTEVNQFGLIHTDVGFPWDTHKRYNEAIICETVGSLLVKTLRFATALYKEIGYFGLVDYHMHLIPALQKYPVIPGPGEGEHLQDYRSIEDTITLEFGGSVNELDSALIEYAQRAYQEFLWAFGWNVDIDLVRGHFQSWQLQ